MNFSCGIPALALVLLAAGATASRAQEEVDADPCSGATTLADCWTNEAARADAEMRNAYDALLRSLRGEAAERLKRSQRLWLEFREAHLAMLYASVEASQKTQAQSLPASSLTARVERLTCAAIARRQLARARARALTLLLEPAPDEGCPL